MTPDVEAVVLKALSNEKYKWRTVGGVARETSLSSDVVQKVISNVAGKIVRSSLPTEDGLDLYATRDHFRKSASLSEKLLGAIKNRAV